MDLKSAEIQVAKTRTPSSSLFSGRNQLDNQLPENEPQGQGKENLMQAHFDQFCFKCNRSLAKSRHLINVAGQKYKWHPECFKCDVCKLPMDMDTSCHIYKDKIVCHDDYAKLLHDNSIKCSRCRWIISASDWVRKAGDYVYHLACFSCDICLRQLSTGEQFTINIEDKNTVKLLCRLHFAIENQSNASDNVTDNTAPTSPSQFNLSYGLRSQCPDDKLQASSTNQDQYHYLQLLASSSSSTNPPILFNRKAKHFEDTNQMSDEAHHSGPLRMGTSNQSNCSSSNGSASGIIGMPSKSKRVRTTFTEDQLSILHTHFQIDSNPDGQDLERIATITGLSKRVTQVWFQNSRARQKKHMVKRKPQNSTSLSAAIGLVGGSSQSTGHFSQNLHSESSEDFQLGLDQHNKWANISDRSDVSLDDVARVEDLDDSQSSSENQLDVSENSND